MRVDPQRLIARVDKIQNTLAWKPRYDNLEVIVQSVLLWEQAVAAVKAYSRK